MDFEDIVDMDWVNTHHPTELVNSDNIFIKTEDEQDIVSNSTSFDCCYYEQQQQEIIMPSIEQIKQLIELAKKQLDLKEQQLQQPEPNTNTVSPQSLLNHEKPSRKNSEPKSQVGDSAVDNKNLSSKERRQLRNKISARNFRVRRKEYINTLELQVDDQKKANEKILHRLNTIEEENKQLKMQIDSLKRQNQQLLLLHKDISLLGSKPTETYRQDTSILVS
ncbi:hypothetical protein G6F62_005761 [Rhizopus arrhizus]|nr:hypothetical protein G6F62_005761 [Rhizopus arrhizus]